jgi:Flp pilus assembly protein CpaB
MRSHVKLVSALVVVMVPLHFSHGQDPNRNALDVVLKPGTRAMSITLTTIDPKVLSGSIVDVIQTIKK